MILNSSIFIPFYAQLKCHYTGDGIAVMLVGAHLPVVSHKGKVYTHDFYVDIRSLARCVAGKRGEIE
jgi:hypothetical protein